MQYEYIQTIHKYSKGCTRSISSDAESASPMRALILRNEIIKSKKVQLFILGFDFQNDLFYRSKIMVPTEMSSS